GEEEGTDEAPRRETFDNAQLFNPEQDQSRPDVVEKLNSDEQDPKRNFAPFRSARESNTVMSNKHSPMDCRGFVSNANAWRFTERSHRRFRYCCLRLIQSTFAHEASSFDGHVAAPARFRCADFCCGSS